MTYALIKNASFCASLLCLSISAQAQTKYYIDHETIACATESLWDRQIRVIVGGERRLIRGCKIVRGEPYVQLLDANLTGASKVRSRSTGEVLWVDLNYVVEE